MIPAAFQYTAPASLEEVLALLADRPDEVKVMAGGQSLIPLLRLRMAAPETIIDLRRLEELRRISDAGTCYRIGAMVTHRDLAESTVAQIWGVIRDGAADLADPLVRNRGTFGGSIAHADPNGDWPAVALALDATMHIESTAGGRDVAAEDFFLELFTTAIGEHELLTHVDIPKPGDPGAVSAYVKIPHPASGYPVAGAAAVLTVAEGRIQQARVALTGVALTPVRAVATEAELIGAPLTADALGRAVAVSAEGIEVLGDSYAPEAYRRQLIQVVVRRALHRAVGTPLPAHH